MIDSDFAKKFTLVLGLDEKTLEQARWSTLTWRLNCPLLSEFGAWHIFFDDQQVNESMILDAIKLPDGVPVALVPWSTEIYESQREAMLTGFCYQPIDIRTKYWVKIDTDAVCLERREDLIEKSWFDPEPVWIASPWGYTKAKGGGGSATDWATSLEEWGDKWAPGTKRLGLANKVTGSKIKHRRMASWLSIYNTHWTAEIAEHCRRHFQSLRIPVPSQDTVHWYAAERRRDRYHRVNFKRRGWTNIPRFDKLKQLATEVIRQ